MVMTVRVTELENGQSVRMPSIHYSQYWESQGGRCTSQTQTCRRNIEKNRGYDA